MKKLFFAIVLLSALHSPFSTLRAQTYTQQVPGNVNEIRLEGRAHLVVKSTDGDMMLQTFSKYQVASVKNNRMTISDGDYAITLLLPAGRSMTFVAEDYSNLVFNGSFGKRPQLTVHTEDYAHVLFSGSLADSVWAVKLTLQAEDYSQIHSEVRMMQFGFEVLPKDYAQITIDCFQERYEPGMNERSQTVRTCDHCVVNWNYCFKDTVRNVGNDTAYAQYVKSSKSLAMQKRDSLRNVVYEHSQHRHNSSADEPKKRSIWRHRDTELHFAWGFHNWGSSMFGGFEGADGDAAIHTSFNNIQLSLNYPLIGTRHVGLYVGLGLEWDKYKFDANEITLANASEPYTFTNGGDQSCTSWLNTRYVLLPLTLSFDLWYDWRLSIAALPGIHWGGTHTGLRREYDTDLEDRTEKDQSVNKYINPYKLDLRATLSYENFGLYLQVPTMSTFRSSTQELYPIKFGVFLTID
ncbi:MAG: hypothetical protein IJ634_05700 [Bacteroidales bacterium]|nr:hypothetical protein [Bacteroidales bacterium]